MIYNFSYQKSLRKNKKLGDCSTDVTPAIKAVAFVFPIVGLSSGSGITVLLGGMAALRGGHENIPRFDIGGWYRKKWRVKNPPYN
jgi:hypothetical protein